MTYKKYKPEQKLEYTFRPENRPSKRQRVSRKIKETSMKPILAYHKVEIGLGDFLWDRKEEQYWKERKARKKKRSSVVGIKPRKSSEKFIGIRRRPKLTKKVRRKRMPIQTKYIVIKRRK